MAKRGCFNPWAGIVSTADQGLGQCKDQKGNCEGLDALCSQTNDGLFYTRQILWFPRGKLLINREAFWKGLRQTQMQSKGLRKDKDANA